ncbi:hypothetical protein COB21_03030 [Candidatus Aerophobetes bacterium]|uniref:Uncharacterized protein n=1 Tax=Aerophobetes bacterium TaxID=2030807 RepID=A0A2A4X5C4_UNCAE|nr:MAG: hypothetical protein COB21_03030 [Candidatus Aerophobetes bacterium]
MEQNINQNLEARVTAPIEPVTESKPSTGSQTVLALVSLLSDNVNSAENLKQLAELSYGEIVHAQAHHAASTVAEKLTDSEKGKKKELTSSTPKGKTSKKPSDSKLSSKDKDAGKKPSSPQSQEETNETIIHNMAVQGQAKKESDMLSKLLADGVGTLTTSQITELKKYVSVLLQIEDALAVAAADIGYKPSDLDSDMAAFGQTVNKLLDSSKVGGLTGLMSTISSLVAQSGDKTLQTYWTAEQGSMPYIFFSQCPSSPTGGEGVWLADEIKTAVGTGSNKWEAFLTAIGANPFNTMFLTAVDALTPWTPPPPPTPTPTPPAPEPVKPLKYGIMMSFSELFAVMSQLMESQQNTQAADASLGETLNDKESIVIKEMTSKLNSYYTSNVANQTKASEISKYTANLNLYKAQWDNFKDQIDANVQNQTNSAGTVDVNNIQQTSDFEKDVLQTWANVANQIASL